VFIAKRGWWELTTTIMEKSQVRDMVEKMLKAAGRRVDMSSPFGDAKNRCRGVALLSH